MKTTKYDFLNILTAFILLILAGCGEKKSKEEVTKAGKPAAVYEITSLTNHEFTFNGGGLKKAENPNLTLQRGKTYHFKVEAFGHPFLIKSKPIIGADAIYDKGVVENGIEYGIITFTVPKDVPDILFYICKFHKMMTGKILIVD